MAASNRVRGAVIATAIAFGLAFAAPVRAADQSQPAPFDDKQNKSIQEIIHQYILDHPEVIVEAMQKMQAQQQQAEDLRLREAAKSVKPVAAEDHIRGDLAAPVKVIEFSDFECPFCLRVFPTVTELLKTYGDRIRLAYRHYPLPNHPNARPAAEAAACANEQGKFWQYHDRLFSSPGKLSGDDLKQHAAELGLDAAAFNACVDARKYQKAVDADIAAGEAVGVSGTPAFFINGRPVFGAMPIENFKQIIEEELARKR